MMICVNFCSFHNQVAIGKRIANHLLMATREKGAVERKQLLTRATINDDDQQGQRRPWTEDGIILHGETEPRIYAYWDLCSNYNQSLDPFSLIQNVFLSLSTYGNVEKLYAYGDEKILSFQPYYRKKQKKPYLCYICSNKFATYEKLRGHFKIHTKERRKQMMRFKTRQKRNASGKEERFQSALENMRKLRKVVKQQQENILRILQKQDICVLQFKNHSQAVQQIKEDVVYATQSLLTEHSTKNVLTQDYIIAIISDQDFEKQIKLAQKQGFSGILVASAQQQARIKGYADQSIIWQDIVKSSQQLDYKQIQ
eukprot:TRINITY_DN7440_c1_g1_i1.p1 TRINITY_DN7440_c1_g1~~TRINITY_DN7440_c1_g1_i1.p1  ORF type:complete len:312 (-),score=15.94 TRINITY_DN7440_c1_g1_i1:952-1887(-)